MANTADKLQIIYGDQTLGLKGEGFHYIFSYPKGAFESLKKNGKEWFYRPPMPTFWRAETDNDRGSCFSQRSAMWFGADMFRKCTGRAVRVNGEEIPLPCAPENNRYSADEYADNVDICFTFETCTVPAAAVDVNWHVQAGGRITVSFRYHGKKGLPGLPLVGLRFSMPTKADGFEYEGLSGETYPDRLAVGEPGIYQVEGLPVTPYLVPQDCGMHMNTSWVKVNRSTTLNNADTDKETFDLKFTCKDRLFAFSCLPYTAEELESATHHEELPPARRTVLLILAAVRGVGGIDSWCTDVEEAYHVSGEEDHEITFVIG